MTVAHSLAGKTAMVTGSSSGIGLSIATEFARRGANVIIHGRIRSPRIEAVCKTMVDLGVDCQAVFEDFADKPNWNGFVDQAWAWKGNVDYWVNNAGGDVLTGEWVNRDIEDKLNFLWQVDVVSSLMLSRRAGERMIDSKNEPGTNVILNMGWDQACQGMAGDSGELFSTTKGAIMSMTKSLAQSLAPQVRVNCLAPGWIKTQWGEQASDAWSKRAESESLMNRWGTPRDVAQVAAFLCSDGASFISGQVVPVNGGFNYHK